MAWSRARRRACRTTAPGRHFRDRREVIPTQVTRQAGWIVIEKPPGQSVKKMAAANCVFCKIVRGEISSRKVYEDDEILAFHDINPVAPVHFMLIPKEHVASLAHVEDRHRQVLGKMLLLAHRLASEQGSPDGFRAVVNTGRVGRQDVPHVHMHVLGGRDPLPGMIQKSK